MFPSHPNLAATGPRLRVIGLLIGHSRYFAMPISIQRFLTGPLKLTWITQVVHCPNNAAVLLDYCANRPRVIGRLPTTGYVYPSVIRVRPASAFYPS
jgi:hypothetical protein